MILISSKLFIEVAAIIILVIALLISSDARLILPTLGIFVAAAYRIIPNINVLIKSVQNLDFGKSTINELSSYFEEQNKDVKYLLKDFQFKNQIEFKDVVFQYDSKNFIFDHANLVIKKNSIIGIYGNSGIGKSTFVDLLTGISNVSSGVILIDDKEISNLDEQAWLAKISYIQQNPFIFNHSIISNIALEIETKKIDLNKIKKVISLLNLNDLASRFKNGYIENIGEFGADISGGQCQRIGIARALYKGSDILIFDESFNSLDKHNRDEILDLIRKLKTNATIIIISHDNSSFVHCDEVYRIVNKNFEKKI